MTFRNGAPGQEKQGKKMSDYTDTDKKQDLHILHSMGYAQELERRMSQFSNFAISFSIICILAGGINSLAQATAGAGGAAIGIGWPLGCFISLVFAVAMAQIGSAYPTAGGLYHWGSILGNRFTGWLTAWFNLLGLVTVLGSINVGTYYFFMGSFGAPYFGLEDTTTTRIVFLAIITGAQALVNHMGIGLTAKLTDFSGYLIFATAILLAVPRPIRRRKRSRRPNRCRAAWSPRSSGRRFSAISCCAPSC
ncbi:amino acid transporter [Sinorhizobium fredii]